MAGKLIWFGPRVLAEVFNASRQAVDETTEAAAEAAINAAPVDTGALRASIRSQPASAGSGGISGSWGSEGIPYALYVELGTSKMSAQPFLRPSADAENSKLAERIKSRV